MSENEKYTFTYWNLPGRGESIRVMMAIGGLDFEENFVPLFLPLPNPEGSDPVPFDEATWAKLKNTTPWGNLPTLTLPDGRTFGQQRAILRYLAKHIQHNGMPLCQKIRKTPFWSTVFWMCWKTFGQFWQTP